MSKSRKASKKATREKRVEPEAVTRNKLHLAIILTSVGVVLIATGLLLGRGIAAGASMFSLRFFMLVLGASFLLAGIVGLLAHILVVGANRQVNKGH